MLEELSYFNNFSTAMCSSNIPSISRLSSVEFALPRSTPKSHSSFGWWLDYHGAFVQLLVTILGDRVLDDSAVKACTGGIGRIRRESMDLRA